MKSALLVVLAFSPLGFIRMAAPADQTPPAPTIPVPTISPNSVKLATTNFAPLGYFDQNCARCHGPNGSFYGDDFGKNLNDAQMRAVVKAMAEGPGNAPLSDTDLEVETGYHIALREHRPFVALVSIEKKDDGSLIWHGEASPDSKVRFESGRTNLPITLNGFNWSLPRPVGSETQGAKIVAIKDGKTTTLDLAIGSWSDGVKEPVASAV